MQTLFVGGPGRSGTSFVADRLAAHPQICAFREVELKFFTEQGGLLDLWNSLGKHYSPNRAVVALRQFRRLAGALIDGRFGQPGLATLATAREWWELFDGFADALTSEGHPGRSSAAAFDAAARHLIGRLHELARAQSDAPPTPKVFLEKTPHALLEMAFLTRLAPGAKFLHVMRDPRSIARSLRAMSWGPDQPATCCAWVASYCSVWQDVQQMAGEAGLDLQMLKIENVAAAQQATASSLTAWLGIAPAPELFARADPATLNGWASDCPSGQLAELTDRLAPWISAFGYRVETVGTPETIGASANGVDPATAPEPVTSGA